MRRRRPAINSRMHASFWHRFDLLRSKETGGDWHLILENFVSTSVPAYSTHRDLVEKIARESTKPIPIASIPDDLSQRKFIRGKTVHGSVGDEIDKIAAQYENIYWWISKEGLTMAIVSPSAPKLCPFDVLAGKFCVDRWNNGRLSKQDLMVIAKELDAAGFLLREQLQPAQWKLIAEYNQRNPRRPIKTFEKASLHRRFVRAVRRRMYVARKKYVAANAPVLSLPGMS